MSALVGVFLDQVTGNGARLVDYEAVLILNGIRYSVGNKRLRISSTYDDVGNLPEGLVSHKAWQLLFAFAEVDRDDLEVDILLLADKSNKTSASRSGKTVELDGHCSCEREDWGWNGMDQKRTLYSQSTRG